MTKQELPDISGLTTRAVRSIDEFQVDQTEEARRDALESVTRLLRALESPADAIYKLFASV
jgi:hypothetical protein